MKVSGDKGETKGSRDQIYNELEADMVAKLVTTLINVSALLWCVLCTSNPVSLSLVCLCVRVCACARVYVCLCLHVKMFVFTQ